jgi:hypothetical protein
VDRHASDHAWRTVLDNGNHRSFLKTGLRAPPPTISILVTVLSVVPSLSAGYRLSDLVLWHEAAEDDVRYDVRF